MMNSANYQEECKRTQIDPKTLINRLWENRETFLRLDQASHGLNNESGEISSAIEKWIYYGQELDKLNLKEEVGDCLWYLSQICNAIGVTLEDCAEANTRKLKARYPEKFETENSKEENRDRDKERQVVGDKE